MKTNQSEYAGKRIIKKIYKVVFLFMLTFTMVLTVLGGFHNVYAAPLEDCDLDGYDDATGVPVPWPGYDETKGDTPDGAAGSKTPTTTSGSTNNTTTDKSDNVTPGKTSTGDSGKTNSEKDEDAKNTDSGKKDSTKSNNTASENSGKTNNTTAGKTGSSDKGKTDSDKNSSTKSNNSVKDNTSKTDSDKNSSEALSNKSSNVNTAQDTGKTESEDAGSTVQNNSSNKELGKTDVSTSDNTKDETADSSGSLVSSEENNQDEVSQGNDKQTDVDSDNGDTVNASASSDDIDAVINTKGSLEIKEATGSIIHAGSSVIISGSGFAGDIKELTIEIQSEPRTLGIAQSSADGSFQSEVNIPKDLKAGVHHLVVLYQGKEIIRQQIEVGPKAADSFLEAFSVGFTKDNAGLIPGLLILSGLFVLGLVVLGVNVLTRSRQKK